MTTPTRWDTNRAKKKGQRSAGLPTCRRCGRTRALDPCRDCATPAEAAHYPADPRTDAQREHDRLELEELRR